MNRSHGSILAALILSCALAPAAWADQNSPYDSSPLDASGPIAPVASPLPTFAQAPPGESDPWAGFSAGAEIAFVGGSGVRGGVGGDAWIGYSKELSNHVVIDVQAVSGYAPNIYKYSNVNGLDFAGARATVGYDMGRLEPYVLAGVDVAKPNFGAPERYDTSDSLDNIFNKGHGPLWSMTTVGAGVNYQVTPNFRMGVRVTATQVNAPGDDLFISP